MTRQDVRRLIAERVGKAKNQMAFAREMRISQSHLSNILSGRAAPSKHLLSMLGIEMVVTYRLKGEGAAETGEPEPPLPRARLFSYGDWPVLRRER